RGARGWIARFADYVPPPLAQCARAGARKRDLRRGGRHSHRIGAQLPWLWRAAAYPELGRDAQAIVWARQQRRVVARGVYRLRGIYHRDGVQSCRRRTAGRHGPAVAAVTPMSEPILSIRNLKTYFSTDVGEVRAVDDVSLAIPKGKAVALVGESGSGKSMTALSVMRLVPEPAGKIVGGEIFFKGTDLLRLSPREMRAIRGNDISMIFQEPMTSLNPVFRIGSQIAATIQLHRGVDHDEARRQTI